MGTPVRSNPNPHPEEGADPLDTADPIEAADRAYRRRVDADLAFMRAVAQVAQNGLYRQEGYEDAASWVAGHFAMGYIRACEFTEVALCLEELPKLADAYRSGDISYDHLRALVEVTGRYNEADLLEATRGTSVSATFDLVDRIKGVSVEDSRAAHGDRWLEKRWNPDGTLDVWARLSEEQGQRLSKAIDELTKSIPDDPEGTYAGRTPLGAKRADALADLAGAAVSEGSKPLVVVHVDAEILESDEGTAELAGGPLISAETARRLACDSKLQVIYKAPDGRILASTRATDSVPVATANELARRDPNCQFTTCARRIDLQIHHIKHRSNGGGHQTDNLVRLCRYHHRFVHEHGFRVRGKPPRIEIVRPGLPPIRNGPPRAALMKPGRDRVSASSG